MKVKARILQDYYPTEFIADGVWQKGYVIEIDEVRDQVNIDYLVDTGVIEVIREEEWGV
ncbi:hypothetical protein [Virgibacillus proomii]|uniref:hypothetical protein n=1 Tax=Virgibacillus proomii TaxID=84407 RepID=UPI001C107F88|nr:hypothetical protein [Virgibacillus proomii]MBU5266245.1 hypothetical protein [Virgibacillus proomii]